MLRRRLLRNLNLKPCICNQANCCSAYLQHSLSPTLDFIAQYSAAKYIKVIISMLHVCEKLLNLNLKPYRQTSQHRKKKPWLAITKDAGFKNIVSPTNHFINNSSWRIFVDMIFVLYHIQPSLTLRCPEYSTPPSS